MGTDNLFKKKELSAAKSLKRRQELRESYERVLIVTEGKKTEPLYLAAVCDHFGLNQANIVIDPDSDSSPSSVVAHANKVMGQNLTDPYDRVYCVIDRDTHADFQKAQDQITAWNNRNRNSKIYLIVSTPCFEYWLLLHFIYTTKPFGASGDSPCDELISTKLKKYLSDYEKSDVAIITYLVENKLGTALANAKKTFEAVERTGTDNPKTEMHILIEYLKNLKN